MQHMPLDLAIGYSSLYASFDNMAVQTNDEREAWRSLAAYNGTSQLDERDLKRLTEFIYRVKSLDRVLELDWDEVSIEARKMGIRPDFHMDKSLLAGPDPQICAPLIRS